MEIASICNSARKGCNSGIVEEGRGEAATRQSYRGKRSWGSTKGPLKRVRRQEERRPSVTTENVSNPLTDGRPRQVKPYRIQQDYQIFCKKKKLLNGRKRKKSNPRYHVGQCRRGVLTPTQCKPKVRKNTCKCRERTLNVVSMER